MSQQSHASARAEPACRTIEFDDAEVIRVGRDYFLIVRGTKPCANMRVSLTPLVYIQCPEYWGIEVIGCVPNGICIEATAPYVEAMWLTGVIGSRGIEVIGANKTEQFDVPGGCSTGIPQQALSQGERVQPKKKG
ncbi:MAG TPA: hypothetical protein VFQ45_08005 [Longimicrobium sp.]|nr:hypothetical protein [Longimicrobium sp.]